MYIIRTLRRLYPPATILAIAVGGALAAITRFVVGKAFASGGLAQHLGTLFFGEATATLTVNVVGCLVLGVLSRWGSQSAFAVGAATGFCGSLTTFSSFSVDAALMLGAHRIGSDTVTSASGGTGWLYALSYIGLTVAAGCAAFILGRVFVSAALKRAKPL